MVETEEAATEGRTGQPAQWARQRKMYHKRLSTTCLRNLWIFTSGTSLHVGDGKVDYFSPYTHRLIDHKYKQLHKLKAAAASLKNKIKTALPTD